MGLPNLSWKDKHISDRESTFDIQTVGKYLSDVNLRRNDWENLLFHGDNLRFLQYIVENIPEKIDLIYIDPPFATGDNFSYTIEIGHKSKIPIKDAAIVEKLAYNDTWDNDITKYLQMMYERLYLMRQSLAKTGSIFVHLDWHISHYVKVILDEIFGKDNLRSEIIWQRTGGHHLSNKKMDVMTDTILWYSKSDNYVYHQPYQDLSSEEMEEKFPYIEKETGRRFTHEKLEQSSNSYSKGEERIIQGKKVVTSIGWRWTQETFDKRLKKNPNLIYWTENGRPRYKRYADEYRGRKIGNLWNDIQPLTSNKSERVKHNYPTQKPESLLTRIIKMCSDEGDLIADFFCGSGTTVAVAEKLNRRWLASDSSKIAIHTTKKRLLNITKNQNVNKFQIKPFLLHKKDPEDFVQEAASLLDIEVRIKDQYVSVCLADFKFPDKDLISGKLRAKITDETDYVDYWAIDFDFENVFSPTQYSFRTGKRRELSTMLNNTYEDHGEKEILIEVVDVFLSKYYRKIKIEI